MYSRRDIVRNYYQSALETKKSVDDATVWSSGEIPTNPYAGNLAKFAVGAGGLFAAGNINLPGGGRVWDKYVGGLRHFEEYFFGKIPRTLQLSNFFSQYESKSLSTRIITPEHLGTYSAGQISYLEKLTGRSSYDIVQQGLRFQDGKLHLHQSGEVLLDQAGIYRNITGSHHLSTAYARSLGADVSGALFKEKLAFTNAAGQEASEAFQIFGGKSKLQSIGRQFGGIGTELVERANRLAKAPLGMPIVGDILNKLHFNFGVKSGPGFKTLARMVGKFAIGSGALALGYQTADWAVRNTDALNNTIFDQGITAAGANIWAKGNLAYAGFSEATGWTDYSKRQEEIAPGSTNPLKLAAFPIIGALAGATTHYIQRATSMLRMESHGYNIEQVSRMADRLSHSFTTTKGILPSLGKALRESNYKIFRRLGKSKIGMMSAIGAVAGLIPTLPFWPGALAAGETKQELEDIYTGKKEVAIRKGRWWEMGRSSFEGDSISYYRPHAVSRILRRGKEKQIWGPLEKNGELSPLTKFWKENFTYDVESAHYQDRPYPLTGAAFSSVPIVGPLLSATLGQVVKPQMAMHTDEYYNSSSGDYLQLPTSFGQDRVAGEELPGSPINPMGAKGVAGDQIYRISELSGLPGFLASTIKQKITGTQDWFDQQTILASANTINSSARDYTDLNIGGALFTSEGLRRLIPHKRNQIDTYNPIENNMPSWMPGAGERSPDFRHGDPYSLIPEGEIRLPGEGYASRFKELEGINPDKYPLIHRFKILADVAPFSEKFDTVHSQLKEAIKGGYVSGEDQDLYKTTKQQLDSRKNKKVFSDYLYRDKQLNPISKALEDWNNKQKEVSNNPSWFQKTLGSYWETLAHNSETPLEFITPLSPAAKLVHMRTATEDYEQNQVYGTQAGFWDKPYDNFIRPFLDSSGHAISGKNSIPGSVQSQRNLEEYFDILKYLKFTKLKRVASSVYDQDAVTEFEQKRRETMAGINPYTYDYTEIFRGLPRRDRDYFNSFSETKDMNERAKILSLIPENEKGLYIAKWRQSDATDFAKATKLGILTDDQAQKGQEQLQNMYSDMESEGMPKNKDLFKEYISSRLQGESYPDWYRRAKLLPKRAEELGFNIPGPDFVGWNPNTDLDDIKLKVVKGIGGSIQDYDLWPTREKQLLYKQDIINDESVQPVMIPNKSSESEIRKNIQDILTQFNISDSQVFVSMGKGDRHNVSLDIQENREVELNERVRQLE